MDVTAPMATPLYFAMPQSIGRSEPAAPEPQTAFMTVVLSKSAASSFVSICDDPKTAARVMPWP